MISSGTRRVLAVAAAGALLGAGASVSFAAGREQGLGKIGHFVVIYQENHSFDNLFSEWEKVNGLAAYVPQVDQRGERYSCLPQIDVNLRSPVPLPATCLDTRRNLASAFTNFPFPIEKYIQADDRTCPQPDERTPAGVEKGKGLPGGCTMDLDHRFYQEQYQIDGGKMDRYVTGSNAAGLAVGYYRSRELPLYKYLHERNHPNYVIADNFFQAAFGGSFLNHQWLIAARTPQWPNAVNDGKERDLHSVVDANEMPKRTPLYQPVGEVKDGPLSASCQPGPGRPKTPAGVTCGDYAVNTIQSASWPFDPSSKPEQRLPLLETPTIGDRLTAAGIGWGWYSGGWADAEGATGQAGFTGGSGPVCGPGAIPGSIWPRCPDRLFQFHHQPFNYYAAYAPGTEARREHLRDEEEFRKLVASSPKGGQCQLRAVSFVKPLGADNEHPGYASERNGNSHLVDLLRSIEKSACAADTMVIVTYDEFGGQADHVPPPSPTNPKGPYDQWGPGTRIPAVVIAPGLPYRFAVDHQEHDTTSILTTVERRFGLAPLGPRDGAVEDLGSVYQAPRAEEQRRRR
ncbi:hypothetical protein L4X63_05475 [Geomonas sp. Red32]|uniref:alkaline phosphatase family protein n=1 Tax=Geomonas sp. Red32 TaxID=2912856 RepID=UPI00202CDEE4|nr:alkaline phosphatase family protein [Geomonas sp. Red32]MCM0081034.1 hypothetical protein [Geomonas sp. Red32]